MGEKEVDKLDEIIMVNVGEKMSGAMNPDV
jgi:hypothetical protein